jgi:MFS family permease
VPAAATPPVPAIPQYDAPQYKDRSTGLVIFGVMQIILGLLAALMVPFAALGALMSNLAPGMAMRPGRYISGIASYAFISAVLLALGIGSVQTKRWARALTLVLSWYGLVSGALITVLLTAALPVAMRSALQAQHNVSGTPPENISTGVMAVVVTMIIVFAAFFLIVVPIAFIVFYSRQDVADTCRFQDPVERWTDRTPLPVLGASVVLSIQAVYLLLTGLSTPLFPFFGRYLHGVPGFTGFILVAALDAYLAVGMFRLKTVAWWIAIVTAPIRLFSMAITYARVDMMQTYSRMGLSDEQLRVLNGNPLFHSHAILWWSLISMVILYGYIVWLKRYYKTPSARPQPEPLPA